MKQLKKQRLDVACRGAIRTVAVVGLLAMMPSIPAYASSMYSQPPELLGGSLSKSVVTTNSDGSDADTWVYDDFKVTHSGAVSNITWQGEANSNAAGFTIQILTQQPVTPDTFFRSAVVKTINVPNNTSQTPNVNGLYDFHVDLVNPFTLISGIPYWITIYSNGTVPWAWSEASGGDGKSISFNRGGAKWLPAPGDRAFTLNDSTIPAVPVPGAIWLFGSGLMGLLSVSWRKHKTANG